MSRLRNIVCSMEKDVKAFVLVVVVYLMMYLLVGVVERVVDYLMYV